MWQILNAAVRETLAKSGSVPLLDFDNTGNVEIPVATRGISYDEPRSTTRDDYNPFLKDTDGVTASTLRSSGFSDVNYRFDTATADDDFITLAGGGSAYPQSETDDQFEYIASEETPADNELNFDNGGQSVENLFCFNKRYAICSIGGRMAVIDLHRAHERILYDTFRSMLLHGSTVSQQLLFPQTLTVSNEEYATVEEYAVDFASLGFDMEFKGDCTLEIRGIPADTSADGIDTILYEMIQSLSLPQTLADVRKDRLAATLARGAVRFNAAYTAEEAARLIPKLFASTNPTYSPSGKRIIAEFSPEEIQAKLQ